MSRYTVIHFLLLLTLGTALASSTLIACDRLGCPRGDGSPSDIENDLLVKIGKFNSKDAGMRAAIKRLALETQRCPETKTFRIMWIGPSDENESEMQNTGGGRALLYFGTAEAKTLGYEHDFLSGSSSRLYLVDRAAIKAVAEKGGTLEDFDQYDQKSPSTRKSEGQH